MSDQESSVICSARGCLAAATWAVVWNNPRLHTPDREKIWVACGEHKQPLADYLAVRSFLKRVEPLEAGYSLQGTATPPAPLHVTAGERANRGCPHLTVVTEVPRDDRRPARVVR
jgi:hypothetical protein